MLNFVNFGDDHVLTVPDVGTIRVWENALGECRQGLGRSLSLPHPPPPTPLSDPPQGTFRAEIAYRRDWTGEARCEMLPMEIDSLGGALTAVETYLRQYHESSFLVRVIWR